MGDDVSSRPEIRVLLAYENDMVRAALQDRFKTDEADIVVVADVRDGEGAVRLSTGLRPDVVLIDVVLPVMNGIEATRQIAQSLPDVCIVGLSLHDDPHFKSGMLEAGARAYLLVDSDWDGIPNRIRALVAS